MPWRRRTRGQATIIGAVLFFAVAVLLVNFLYEVSQLQYSLVQYDQDRAQERFEISSAFFGGIKTNYPNSTTPEGSGQISNLNMSDQQYITFQSNSTIIKQYPVDNMNFTYNRNGWLFQSTSRARGVTAAFVQYEGNPSPGSRAGSVYSSLQGRSRGPYWLNWTYYFTYSGGAPAAAYFSWARKVANWTQISTSTVYVTLQDPTAGSPTIITSASVNSTSPDQGAWLYETDMPVSASLFEAAGTYALTVALYASTKSSTKANIWVSFDDVGIVLETEQGCSTDWYSTFKLSEVPNDITALKFQYTGHYSTTVFQTLYLWDYETNDWHELSKSTVRESDLTQGPFEVTDFVERYVSPLGEVNVRIRGEAAVESITCYADQLLLTDNFKDRTKFAIQIENIGSSRIDIVAIWIDNSTHHERITLKPAITLVQGETYTYINYTTGLYFSTCTYEIKALTQRGNMWVYNTS